MQNQNNNWLVLSPSTWSDLRVSNHYIASEFSKKSNKVIYVEFPGIIGLSFKRIFLILKNYIKKNSFNKINIPFSASDLPNANFKIIKQFYLPFTGLPFVDFFIFKIFLDKKFNLINKIQNSKNILICSPVWLNIFKLLEKEQIIDNNKNVFFHLVDDPQSYSHLKFYMKKFKLNLKIVKGIISPNAKLLKKFSSSKSNDFQIKHGFHIALPINKYLNSNLNRTRSIVYAGTFANWCDYNLIKKISNKFPDVKIYFVGKVARNLHSYKLNYLKNCNNINLINSLSRQDLHNFLLEMYVSIIPYIPNDNHIKFSSPSKIMDYLGCGLPVISTDIFYCKNHKFVKIAKNNDEFLDLIEYFLNYDQIQRKEMINYAINNSWENNVNKLLFEINK